MINERKVSLVSSCRSYKTFCYRKHVCFSLSVDKTCVRDVFLRVRFLKYGHPDNKDTSACPLGVRINRVPP